MTARFFDAETFAAEGVQRVPPGLLAIDGAFHNDEVRAAFEHAAGDFAAFDFQLRAGRPQR